MVGQYLWWSDPFLEFYKQTESGCQLAHRTEVHTFTNTSVVLCTMISSLEPLYVGCKKKPKPSMETLLHLTALSLWRKCGESY